MLVDNIISNQIEKRTENKSDEKLKRSLAKTVSWRVIGTLDTVMISWILTGTITLALSIGAIELVSKMLLYFFHERAWNHIKWGRQ